MPDDRLRLIFTCCHPALAPSAQVALTLRLLGGLRDRARSPVPSWCPRRRWPSGSCGPSARSAPPTSPTACRATPSCPTGCARCSPSSTWSSTRATRPSSGDELVRDDLCAEAIRLARLLAELMPDEPEVARPARAAAADRVPPAGPHRGRRIARAAARPGPDALGPGADRRGPGAGRRRASAATSRARTRSRPRSTRCTATPPTAADTDWGQILQLYDQLLALAADAGRGAQPGGGGGRGARARRRRWRRSTPSTSTATTCSTPPGPTCCAASAATPRRPTPTTPPSRWSATPPSAASSSSAGSRCRQPEGGFPRCEGGSGGRGCRPRSDARATRAVRPARCRRRHVRGRAWPRSTSPPG